MEFVSKTLIPKGWSGDRKYRVVDAAGIPHLLRISPMEKYEQRKSLFEVLQQLKDIPMCIPEEFGICDEGVYTLFSWIDGPDAGEVLPQMPAEAAYALGLQAGAFLQRIHAIPAPAGQEDWAPRFNRKIERKYQMYADCPIKIPGDRVIFEFIEANRHLLQGRPCCFNHGDYHVGNFMLQEGALYIIDFDRYDYEDPWQEFNRISWCAQCSPAFAAGRIDGYFDGTPPEAFFRLTALYIAVNALSSLPWAIPFGQGEIDTMLKQAAEILDWYDRMQNPVPKWYLKAKAGLGK